MRNVEARQGLSLLEVQVALVILFLVAVFIMALFSTGSTSFRRSKDFTTAVFLAQEKMEEILYQSQVSPSSGNFTGAFQEYVYAISVQPYNAQFNMVNVQVTGPEGAAARLNSLSPGPLVFYGTATDQSSSTDNLSDKQNTEEEYSKGAFPPGSFSALGSLPAGANPSGNAVDIFASVNWTGDQNHNTLQYWNGASWTTIAMPGCPPACMGTPTGLATDEYANIVFVADKTNLCLWKYNSNTDKWTRIPAASLGTPAGIATDHYGNIVWVSDAANNALRLYDDNTGKWDPATYAPDAANCSGCGGKLMASPRGVATTQYGDIVYVMDTGKILWEYNNNTGTWSIVSDQSANNSIQSVSGLSTDSGGKTLWMNDPQAHRLWFYDGSTWYSNSY